mgnify:CR=1 FL=1
MSQHALRRNTQGAPASAAAIAPPLLWGMIYAIAGVSVLSFDALLVRLAAAPPWSVAFWRGIGMAATMAMALALWPETRPRRPWRLGVGVAGWGAAALLGLNSVLFVWSVLHTSAANTVVILGTSPLFAGLFSALFLRERVRPATWGAIAAAFSGVAIIFGGSLQTGGAWGDALALAAALSVGAYLTLLRATPGLSRIWVTCWGGLATAGLAATFAPGLALSLRSYVVLAIMGLVQMPLAVVLIGLATRSLSAPQVSLFLLLEAILGPLWVWMGVGEAPPANTWLGALVVLGALAMHALWRLRSSRASKA